MNLKGHVRNMRCPACGRKLKKCVSPEKHIRDGVTLSMSVLGVSANSVSMRLSLQ